MCTIIAKKFKNIGWVGVKNRDRPAATRTKLLRKDEHGYQRVTLVDETTQWTEGMNGDGVSIISSSLVPVTNGVEEHVSKNGLMLRKALSKSTVDAAVLFLKKQDVSGCIMVFDADRLILIEGKAGGNQQQVIQEITNDSVARTNHGIWIPSAGYQPNSNNKLLAMRRISSESRLDIANYIINTATNPYDLMPLLANNWVDNPQLNTIRTPTKLLDTRTTEQLMLEPSKRLILLRNVNGLLDFDQARENPIGSQVLVGIVNQT